MSKFALRECVFVGSVLVVLVSAPDARLAAQPVPPPAATIAAGQPTPIPNLSANPWAGGIGVDFVPVLGSPSPMRQDPAHPFVPNGTGAQPTYRIADLSNPNLKQWAKDLMKKDNDEVLAGKIAFTPRQSCMPAGVPGFILYGGGAVHFVQTPKKVTMVFDGDMQVRHVYMDVPHSKDPKPSWYGESIGRYEGDTLVIDTIGQNASTVLDAYRTPHSDKLHVVERWRITNEGNGLEVLVTIDDPETFNQPWQAIRRYRKAPGTLGEQICAEGNFLLFDYGIPVANKSDF
jgi:hypothetical protein